MVKGDSCDSSKDDKSSFSCYVHDGDCWSSCEVCHCDEGGVVAVAANSFCTFNCGGDPREEEKERQYQRTP